jgi:hypothetical protein
MRLRRNGADRQPVERPGILSDPRFSPHGYDPNARAEFAETHVRRLEAMRRLTGAMEREPDGTWVIASDHLENAAAYGKRSFFAGGVTY